MSKWAAWQAFESEGKRVQANQEATYSQGQIELLRPKKAKNSVALRLLKALAMSFLCVT